MIMRILSLILFRERTLLSQEKTHMTIIVMAPTNMPKAHRPVWVVEAAVGSVARKTVPKAQPPRTTCQYHGMLRAADSTGENNLNKRTVPIKPISDPTMIRHEAEPVRIKYTAPIKHPNADVTPNGPG